MVEFYIKYSKVKLRKDTELGVKFKKFRSFIKINAI